MKLKYIVLLYNKVSFNPKGYGHEVLVKESKIEYLPLSSQIRNRLLMEI